MMVGKCPMNWGFVEDHLKEYLLKMKYPQDLGDVAGHLPTPVV